MTWSWRHQNIGQIFTQILTQILTQNFVSKLYTELCAHYHSVDPMVEWNSAMWSLIATSDANGLTHEHWVCTFPPWADSVWQLIITPRSMLPCSTATDKMCLTRCALMSCTTSRHLYRAVMSCTTSRHTDIQTVLTVLTLYPTLCWPRLHPILTLPYPNPTLSYLPYLYPCPVPLSIPLPMPLPIPTVLTRAYIVLS